jgi:hypothetical protein
MKYKLVSIVIINVMHEYFLIMIEFLYVPRFLNPKQLANFF